MSKLSNRVSLEIEGVEYELPTTFAVIRKLEEGTKTITGLPGCPALILQDVGRNGFLRMETTQQVKYLHIALREAGCKIGLEKLGEMFFSDEGLGTAGLMKTVTAYVLSFDRGIGKASDRSVEETKTGE